MTRLVRTILLSTLIVGPVFAQIPSAEHQIAAAVLAAPEASRAGAAVLGYNNAGSLVTLREGSNEMVCLADDPNRDGFSAACYHKDLEAFMAMGRKLRAEGKSNQERFSMRGEAVKNGTLKMPSQPTTLHVLSSNDGNYDPATGEVAGASLRYVIYVPFATAETTGLPTRPPGPGGPWLMDAGTYRAHIMITPPHPEDR